MNFYDQQKLVTAVFNAAASGVQTAVKALKPSTIAPKARTCPPAFSHLTGSPSTKLAAAPKAAVAPTAMFGVAAAKPAALRVPKYNFAHLVALPAPAARALSVAAALTVPERPAPLPEDFHAAAAVLAMSRGPLASWVSCPNDTQLKAARGVLHRQEQARATADAKSKAEGAALAAKILAAGDYRGVRRS